MTTCYRLHRHDFDMGKAQVGGCILDVLSCNLSDKALYNRHDLLARSGIGSDDEFVSASLSCGHTNHKNILVTIRFLVVFFVWHEILLVYDAANLNMDEVRARFHVSLPLVDTGTRFAYINFLYGTEITSECDRKRSGRTHRN